MKQQPNQFRYTAKRIWRKPKAKETKPAETTKKILKTKIAELEGKLNQLSTQLETKPAEVKPAEAPKPKEAPKPAETTTKPKGTLPKGFGDKPAEAKPAEVKPAETKPAVTTVCMSCSFGSLIKQQPNQKVHYQKDLATNQQRQSLQRKIKSTLYSA